MADILPATTAELRAVSHPLRLSILENLGYRGALTATQLADIVDESPSNCSWHLRKLAEVGAVERVPGTNGRDRPWRITFDSYEFSGAESEERVRSVLVHRQVDRMLRRMATMARNAEAAALRGDTDEPTDERPAVHGSNGTWLTDDEARQVIDAFHRLQALVPDFERRRTDPSSRPEGSHLYEFVGWLVPVEDEL